MKMIVGLGNPEKQYQKTRHNTGYMLLDWLAGKHGATWQAKPKLAIHQAQIEISGEALLLVKPDTNYNNSGLSVHKAMHFYNIMADDILVAHDELVLPLGTIRSREKGSDAGNNGIKNIIEHIGQEFKRIRIGIAQEDRRASDMDFVLSNPSKEEYGKLPEIFELCEKIVSDFARDKFEATSCKTD
jgi:PTH1 family peptidyl-tRNA hydrolase